MSLLATYTIPAKVRVAIDQARAKELFGEYQLRLLHLAGAISSIVSAAEEQGTDRPSIALDHIRGGCHTLEKLKVLGVVVSVEPG